MTERALSLIQIPLLPRIYPAPLILLIPCPQPSLLWPFQMPAASTPLWYLPNLLQSSFPIARKHSCSIPTPFGSVNPCELPYFCKIPTDPTQSSSTPPRPQSHPNAVIAAIRKSISAACASGSLWKRNDRKIETCWDTNDKHHSGCHLHW